MKTIKIRMYPEELLKMKIILKKKRKEPMAIYMKRFIEYTAPFGFIEGEK